MLHAPQDSRQLKIRFHDGILLKIRFYNQVRIYVTARFKIWPILKPAAQVFLKWVSPFYNRSAQLINKFLFGPF